MLFLISCGKEEKEVPIYCCDPEINDWVITNQSYLNTLSRSELVVYGPEKVKAAFISFHLKKKQNYGKKKLTNFLNTIGQKTNISILSAFKILFLQRFTIKVTQNRQKYFQKNG